MRQGYVESCQCRIAVDEKTRYVTRHHSTSSHECMSLYLSNFSAFYLMMISTEIHDKRT